MFKIYLLAYPWDLSDVDLHGLFARLRGEFGIDGLSAWATTPPCRELRVRNVQPRVFSTRGGFFFPTADRFYAHLRCRPIVSTWVRAGNPLARIAEACDRHDLKMRAVLSAATTGRMAERYPEFACRNVYGDASELSLCLANKEVQSLLAAAAADLSAGGTVAGLVLADYRLGWWEAWSQPWRSGSSWGDVEQSLLGVCFCESCRRHAVESGIDAAAVQESTRRHLQRALELGASTDAEPSLPALTDYRRCQSEALDAGLRAVKTASRCPVLVTSPPPGFDDGVSPTAGLADVVITDLGAPRRQEVPETAGTVGGEIQLSAEWTMGGGGSQFVGFLAQAAQSGVTAATLDHFGILPDTALTTVKQAARFARRTAEA